MAPGTTARMKTGDLKCLEVASKQMGVLHRAQALEHLSLSQVERRVGREPGERWVRVHRGVYRVEGAPQCWRQKVEALALWGGEKCVLSHRTAAALHGLDGFRVDPLGADGPLDITVKPQKRKPKGARIYRVKPPPHYDVVIRDDGLRVTSVARTLFDLSAQLTWGELREAMSQALRQKMTTLVQLKNLLKRTRKRPGIRQFRGVVAQIAGEGGPTDSQLEELALGVLRSAGLPRPVVQRRVVAGQKRRRLDLLFEKQKVVIETDGYAYHSSVDVFEKDRVRRNALVMQGYVVLQWTWQRLKFRPEELISELCAVLHRHS